MAGPDPAAQRGRELNQPAGGLPPFSPWKYDLFLSFMSIIIDLFFREVRVRGSSYVPRSGPVLFIVAPHVNQFIDGLLLQRALRNEAGRQVSLLVAQKSLQGFVGWGARQVGSLPVGRSQDMAKSVSGLVYLPDPDADPTLIHGVDTDFVTDAEVGGMLFLPSAKGVAGSSVDIAEIMSPRELRIKRPVQAQLAMQQLTARDNQGRQGTRFKISPRIDQTKLYQAVFDRLKGGDCVGIFPEGGSHDRTDLLPLKAGVAIMALGTMIESPDCGLTIVPVGMNYFHAHKFRSRAVVEFGSPFEVQSHLVEKYLTNRREAIAEFLQICTAALNSVTVSAPDYETLMCIQAARRLYTNGKLPLSEVMGLNRILSQGLLKYEDDQRIADLLDNIKRYNSQLRHLQIADHQVDYAVMSVSKVAFLLLTRLTKLAVLSVGVVAGLVLFSPVFIVSKVISNQKAKSALAASSVKIAGRDIIATWKILMAMGLAPVLYNFYISVLVYTRAWGYAPDYLPWYLIFLLGWIIFPATTFAALLFGEISMDIVKSLRPLLLCLGSSTTMQKLRSQRSELVDQVREVINMLDSRMGDDDAQIRKNSKSENPSDAFAQGIPRNESFSNIGTIDIFPTRPPSQSGSRSSSNDRHLASDRLVIDALTRLNSKEDVDTAGRGGEMGMDESGLVRRRKGGLPDGQSINA
ncbi:acyltransferase [Trichoderma velutinum]